MAKISKREIDLLDYLSRQWEPQAGTYRPWPINAHDWDETPGDWQALGSSEDRDVYVARKLVDKGYASASFYGTRKGINSNPLLSNMGMTNDEIYSSVFITITPKGLTALRRKIKNPA